MYLEKEIEVNLLISHTKNRNLDEAHVKSLAASILTNGLLDAPIVSKNNSISYTILAGHHRVAAFRYLREEGHVGFDKIRCRIVNKDEIDQELILIDSNLESKGLTVYETMMAIGRKEELLKFKKQNGDKVKGLLSDVIAKSIHDLNARQVRTYLKVYKDGGEELKKALKENRITLSDAEKIAKLPKREQLSAISNFRKKKKKLTGKNKDIFIADMEEKMESSLMTKVNIDNGNINIKYYNVDDLNRILEQLGFLDEEY